MALVSVFLEAPETMIMGLKPRFILSMFLVLLPKDVTKSALRPASLSYHAVN